MLGVAGMVSTEINIVSEFTVPHSLAVETKNSPGENTVMLGCVCEVDQEKENCASVVSTMLSTAQIVEFIFGVILAGVGKGSTITATGNEEVVPQLFVELAV